MNTQTLLIASSSLLALISPFVYARAILRHEAKPHRTTRFVLLIITLLTAASLFAQHNTVAVWLASVSALQSILIFLLSLKYGMGGWAKSDILCLAVAVTGIVLWQATDNALLALYFAILADFTGMIPALIKTFRYPETEIWSFYALDVGASLLNLAAIRKWNLAEVSYPFYIMAINLAMVGLVLRKRRNPKVSRRSSPPAV